MTDCTECTVEYPLKRRPSHPGAVLNDVLPDVAHSKAEIARLFGIPRRHLNDILGERCSITLPVATKLGVILGGGAELWLKLQAAHDSWLADPESTDLSPQAPLA
ncbi:HigA family addiction module antidote protein [Rhizobium sp. KVB221]|uniref:HigA family addiction module antidote protein n=1 Tax=Rhizobium setariae TaxID=2801340 RepID=A0A937CKY0_9HYPH|nr:HigA family addiction module antitoxin [Rhizobium setariae]MBL0372605.1 HigA family addiction module antidote protein [Rhizobium setariae]